MRQLPDHWVVLVDPPRVDAGSVALKCWTWGSVRNLRVARADFERDYFGSLVVTFSPPS